MSPKLIEVKQLKKSFINDEVVTPVLHGLTFSIDEGEFVSIMGRSGSGKSTLMNILGFLDRPTEGEYLFKNKNILTMDENEMAAVRNRQIGFIFQSFNLLPRTSVYENVRLPLLYSQRPSTEHAELIERAIADVGLSARKDFLSNQLSGGEKQRVAIARALVNRPSIIFADEPTGNLDSKNAGQIMNILQQLDKANITIILVTHENDVAEHANRIITLKDGLIETDRQVTRRRFTEAGGEIAK